LCPPVYTTLGELVSFMSRFLCIDNNNNFSIVDNFHGGMHEI